MYTLRLPGDFVADIAIFDFGCTRREWLEILQFHTMLESQGHYNFNAVTHYTNFLDKYNGYASNFVSECSIDGGCEETIDNLGKNMLHVPLYNRYQFVPTVTDFDYGPWSCKIN